MDIKELIEKAFAVGHTIGYGNTENHYKPEFERWWNDENTQKQVKNCSIPDVSKRFTLGEVKEILFKHEMKTLKKETKEKFEDWQIEKYTKMHIEEFLKEINVC